MIAMTAVFATVWPNVGPIESDEKPAALTPKRLSSAFSTFCSWPGPSVLVWIWKTFLPSVGSSTCWISRLLNPALASAEVYNSVSGTWAATANRVDDLGQGNRVWANGKTFHALDKREALVLDGYRFLGGGGSEVWRR